MRRLDWHVLAVVAVAALLGLASCGDSVPRGDDGYRFERREFDHKLVGVRKVEHATQAALQAEARRRGITVESGRELQAFALISPTTPVCEIHVVAPEATTERKWLGHEMAHCFYGRWHQ